ncbi:MAG: peptide chain release factor N(5)-glutamine methyltransferase [Chloroflexi bacterium]|nr:peptide chain release factor N(5)-glutamine methyltransferase [Chloroflexota bacterium]
MTSVRAALSMFINPLPHREAALLLAHTLGQSREWVLAHPEAELTPEQGERFAKLVEQAEHGVPLPYLLGQWEFFGLNFKITPDVLIPRPETELLVEKAIVISEQWAVNSEREQGTGDGSLFTVVDVGTGSGIIAVTLAVKLPHAHIVATDISAAALDVARANAVAHGVANRVQFIHGDLLEGVDKVNLICANLPYIPTAELETLPVARHEPALALDGGPDGLRVIERLLATAGDHLLPGGALLAETAATQGKAAASLACHYFPSARVEVHKDLAGLDRLLLIEMHNSQFSMRN